MCGREVTEIIIAGTASEGLTSEGKKSVVSEEENCVEGTREDGI